MPQAKVSLTDEQAEFLDGYANLGFPDKSSLVRAAIDRLRKDLAEKRLRESAERYAEVYASDKDLRSLTDEAANGWPE